MRPIFEDIKEGDVVINLMKPPITKLQLIRYAGASGDFNPLHTDDDVGRAAGFDGAVAHGMLMMGITAQAITNWIPKSSLKTFKVRFKGPTRPGDVIKVIGKVTDKRIEREKGIVCCSLEAMDQHCDVKISGSFEAVLPLKKEKNSG